MNTMWRAWVVAAALLMTSAVPALAQGSVQVEVESFGVGGYFRPGGMTGLRLKLTSSLAEPTPVWVQWQVPNADGDVREIGRSLTLTPNQPAWTWLYAWLLPETDLNTVWTVRVFEERDGIRGAELGGARISPSVTSASGGSAATGMVAITAGMIAVVGDNPLGLDEYSDNGYLRMSRPIGAHEDTRVVHGLRVSDLPDRWFGWEPYEAIAWAADQFRSPQDMSLDQAEALREAVARGKHLIIVLPADTDPWGMGVRGRTQFEDLLPCRTPDVVPRVDVDVPLNELLPVLGKHASVRALVRSTVPVFSIRVFRDLLGEFNVIDNHYQPLIALPDGRVVAVQRSHGFGRVTVVGIDLADGRLNAALQLPQADAFWNRVLGRRMDTPSPAELKAMDDQEQLSAQRGTTYENSLGAGALVSGRINMSSQAHAGLLLALVLFVAYWLVAGPLGFAALRHYRQSRHAWVAFAACAALFTAIAWGSVGLLPKTMQVKHLTFLDQIAAPLDSQRPDHTQQQRLSSYFSLYTPNYGAASMALESESDRRDLLTAWAPAGEPQQPFPNVDRYPIDIARSAASFTIPSRSTSTHLYAHWMGGVGSNWGGLVNVDPNNPVTTDNAEQTLRGTLINNLPGRLTNVTVIWVKNNRLEPRAYLAVNGVERPWVAESRSGQPLNTVGLWRFPADTPWEPGESRNLGGMLAQPFGPMQTTVDTRYIRPFAGDLANPAIPGNVSEDDRVRFLEMLGIFQQLNPPSYHRGSGGVPEETVSFQRRLGRELDLSHWFTQPCLIIVGFLENSDCPLPLRIDGDDQPPLTSPGSLTVVRWIHPLPLIERLAFKDVFDAAPPAVPAAPNPDAAPASPPGSGTPPPIDPSPPGVTP